MQFLISLKKTVQVYTKMMTYLGLAATEGANVPALKNRFMRELLLHLRLKIQVKNEPLSLPSPAIFVCNHISYLDIPILMSKVHQASFVSKSEVAHWPIIGECARVARTVFVKRGCKQSRQLTREAIYKAITEEKKSIAVFPSGTTKIVKAPQWRRGVFEIAQEHQVPVIPLRLSYTPLRKAAYIDKDNFLVHLLAIFSGEALSVQLEFGEPRMISDSTNDAVAIHAWCEELMAADASTQNNEAPITASPVPG